MPLSGDIIPSRWAYEALAVTSFSDNPYEKPFFELDKEKYETQFYNLGFLDELDSQLETMNDEQKRGKEVKPEHMTEFCGMKPYEGDYSYQSLKQYLSEAEQILAKRSNASTLKADALMSSMIRSQGREAVMQLKADNYNLRLEEFVIGADNGKLLDVVHNHIVPRTALIFLTPKSKIGRAPFYSSEKIIGSMHIKTLWFNLAAMLLMCIVAAILLFTDCPGRYIRGNQNT